MTLSTVKNIAGRLIISAIVISIAFFISETLFILAAIHYFSSDFEFIVYSLLGKKAEFDKKLIEAKVLSEAAIKENVDCIKKQYSPKQITEISNQDLAQQYVKDNKSTLSNMIKFETLPKIAEAICVVSFLSFISTPAVIIGICYFTTMSVMKIIAFNKLQSATQGYLQQIKQDEDFDQDEDYNQKYDPHNKIEVSASEKHYIQPVPADLPPVLEIDNSGKNNQNSNEEE